MNKNMYIGGGVIAIIIIGAIIWAMGGQTTKSEVAETSASKETTAPQVAPEVAPAVVPEVAGLKIEVLSQGTGSGAQNGQTISVDYTGMFTDGKVFDSSIPRGQPLSVVLGGGQVIKGWDLGIVGMKVGEKRRLTISPELAYGAAGFPGAIPPNSTLVFEITLKGIK